MPVRGIERITDVRMKAHAVAAVMVLPVYNVSGDIEQLAEPKLTFIMDGDSVVAISFYSGSNAQS